MSDNDLARYFADRMQDPEFRGSYEDGEAVDALIDALIELRRRTEVTQTELAKRMGVKQPTISGFENQDSDPRVTTIQRYARALGARVSLGLEVKDQHGNWVASARRPKWSVGEHGGPEPRTQVIVTPAETVVKVQLAPNARAQWFQRDALGLAA